jgi:hypothetical protein
VVLPLVLRLKLLAGYACSAAAGQHKRLSVREHIQRESLFLDIAYYAWVLKAMIKGAVMLTCLLQVWQHHSVLGDQVKPSPGLIC